MIIGRSMKGFLKVPFKMQPIYFFCIKKPKTFYPKMMDRLQQIDAKKRQQTKPDPSIITSLLKMMIGKTQQNFKKQEQFIQKNINHFDTEQICLLLRYLVHKYKRMVPQGIFLTAIKRIRQIKEISPHDFKILVGLLMRLKWQQNPIINLYNTLIPKLKQFQTEDLCFLIRYTQHLNKINLHTLKEYINQLLTRQNHNRKTYFLLYQTLYSTQAKSNFNAILEYKQVLRQFQNTLKNSEYQTVYGKWEFIESLNKAQLMRQSIEQKLSEYPLLTLKQAVILGGIKNDQLLRNVEEVLESNVLQVAPYYFSQLLSIIPQQKYLQQYLNRYAKQLTDIQKVQIFQKAKLAGISKDFMKKEFLKVFGEKHQINKQLFQRFQQLGQSVGIQHIRKHQDN